MPWARSRNASIASCTERWSWSRTTFARAGSESVSRRTAPRFAANPTRYCCAPSWRSRSIRRRSASAAATTRARETPQLVRVAAKLVQRRLQLVSRA